MAKATGLQRHHGWAPFVTIQPQYSLITRDIEREVLPAALDAGLGVLPWGPLGGGFLSGKYHRDRPPPPDSRISTATDDMEEAWARRATERNWAIVNAVQQVAEQTGHSMPQVALNWLLTRQGLRSAGGVAQQAERMWEHALACRPARRSGPSDLGGTIRW
jgi:aryl-alcohol dehydrogenase-like predicted oxidoreductase